MTDAAHAAARSRAFELIWEVQNTVGAPLDELDAVLAQASELGWQDVIAACLLARVLHARWQSEPSIVEWVARLQAAAEELQDRAMLAAALASRALGPHAAATGMSSLEADAELARAIALLDACDSPALERMNAHLQCGVALFDRGLWELQDEQYAQAELLLQEVGDSLVAAVLLYNQASVHLTWAMAVRCVDPTAVVSQVDRVRGSLQEALALEAMPEDWRGELALMAVLTDGLAGEPVAQQVEELIPLHPEGPLAGDLPLALALMDDEVGLDRALAAARRAAEQFDRTSFPVEYELALCVAAELAARRDGVADGLVYARHLAVRRWQQRMAALDVMRLRIETERHRDHHDQLRRQAYLDPLTGLANRRGLQHYLDTLAQRDVDGVCVLLVDLDWFKQVNDRFGHAVGDEALVEVAKALSGSIRAEDLACRLGGDEFMVVLSTPLIKAAWQRGEQVLSRLRSRPWRERRPELELSVSIGIASGRLADWDDVVAAADATLYESKEAGRGRVSGPHPESSSDESSPDESWSDESWSDEPSSDTSSSAESSLQASVEG